MMRRRFMSVFAFLVFGFAGCSDDASKINRAVNTDIDAASDASALLDATSDVRAMPDATTDAEFDVIADLGPDDGQLDMGIDVDVPDMPTTAPSREVCADPVAITANGLCEATPGAAGILLHVGEVLAPILFTRMATCWWTTLA